MGNFTSALGSQTFTVVNPTPGASTLTFPTAGFFVDFNGCAQAVISIGQLTGSLSNTLNLAGSFSDTNPGVLQCPYTSGPVPMGAGANVLLVTPPPTLAIKVCQWKFSNAGGIATEGLLFTATNSTCSAGIVYLDVPVSVGSQAAAAPSVGIYQSNWAQPFLVSPGLFLCVDSTATGANSLVLWGYI